MTEHQKQAIRNVRNCAAYVVDELTLLADECETWAIDLLNSHNDLVEYVYGEAVTKVYTESGTVYYNTTLLRNIRFTGEEFLKKVAHETLKEMNL